MPTPVQHNQRSEVDPTLMQSSLPQKASSNRPPLQKDRLEMHDSAICSWISSAFWYAIDCINAVYDWVVMAGWNLLAWIGIVTPPAVAAPNRPIELTFLQRAQIVKQNFAEKTPFEQVNILREISCEWTSQPNERQGLLNELKDAVSEELRDALIAHAGNVFADNEVNEGNIAQYLNQMNEESFNMFLGFNEHSAPFAEHIVEILALGWYMNDDMRRGGKPPAQEAHFIALGWIAGAQAYDEFEPDIGDEWLDARFATAKGKLTQSDRDVLLRAYNIRYAQELNEAVGVYLAADHMSAAKTLLSKQTGYSAEVQGVSTESLGKFYGGLDKPVQAKLHQDFYAANSGIREEWKQRFDKWLDDAARDDVDFGQVLDIAMHQMPQVVKKDCEAILAKQDEDGDLLKGLFASNPEWTQKFLDAFITAQVAALMLAQKVGEVDPAIEVALDVEWQQQEKAQAEKSYTGVQLEEEAFKGSARSRVATQVERAFREQYKNDLIKAGWVVGPGLYAKLTGEATEEAVHAAIQASMPH